jgi:hypothetical protein
MPSSPLGHDWTSGHNRYPVMPYSSLWRTLTMDLNIAAHHAALPMGRRRAHRGLSHKAFELLALDRSPQFCGQGAAPDLYDVT